MSTVSAGSFSLAVAPASRRGFVRGLRRAVRLTVTLAVWTGLGVVTGVAAVIGVPKFLGGQAMTVVSGSMEPAIHTGDVVITEPIAPLEVRVGDVVTFRSPERENKLLTHRVREIKTRGDRVYFVTKGDAVNASEEWNAPMSGTLARPTFRLWKLGYVLFWLNHPLGRLALYVVPALLIGGYLLLTIWRPQSTPERAEPVVIPSPDDAGRPAVREELRVEETPETIVIEQTRKRADERVALPTPKPWHAPSDTFLFLPAVVIAAYALFRLFRPNHGHVR